MDRKRVDDEARVSLNGLEPEQVLRALLAVDPHAPPAPAQREKDPLKSGNHPRSR